MTGLALLMGEICLFLTKLTKLLPLLTNTKWCPLNIMRMSHWIWSKVYILNDIDNILLWIIILHTGSSTVFNRITALAWGQKTGFCLMKQVDIVFHSLTVNDSLQMVSEMTEMVFHSLRQLMSPYLLF